MWWWRKWQPTPVFLPGKSQGQGSLVGCRLWGRTVRHNWSDLACMHSECEVVYHYGFDFSLMFNGWTSFHVCISHLYILFEKCLFRSFTHFQIGLFVFSILICYSILYILIINPLSDKCFANLFSHPFDCIFIFLFMPFEVQKCFHFDGIITYLKKIFFVTCASGDLPNKPLLNLRS